ncbi:MULTISPECIES: outer membrane protein assembly factor BamA [Sphingobacterium]|jgi:outer membrane protein insertion porin family|uniref:Outer membrane protein assembly factor BamA n=1 Tax=Sphingobacterium anhuiense TaxID=493780 RepID=A0ABW5YZV9_9SPHI|nr:MULTISPECIES: outer membrane protein assembly factor BamA [Sphingobacterium]MCS3553587.1 outer membrane protein insertion porin family [Sphingobacterium sp. JUb21]MCW2260858.1 outer membrane protein insertion porin family [Sphingobacterium kitahiroshimense]NJI75617.1 outer membrane protein assembly factor BamA [Sphingobacterium sp. B16(2022)]TCR01572.1 Beta-barrel assembly machine subunit BamA [Sphingobacterium sp. JUb20]TCR09156.1 Beta-barrel assembly machine subunit BamA [Sphingobacterium
MKRILFVILFLACTQPQFAQAQVNGTAINLNDPDQISYLSPKDYIIGGVTVSGTQHLDNNVLITISKLVVGQYIEVPSEATSNVVKVMMAQGLFDDVQLWAEKIEGETIFLNIRVNERPRLTRIDINGLSKSQTEEVRKRLKDNAGKVVNENLINTTRNTIQRFLREKAYLYPEIKISTIKDTTQANNEILIADVDRKNKVRVKKITFTGNKEFTQKQLRKNLKGVKQKAWFRIFGPGKFKEEKYKEAKETLVAKMQNKGFRDAEIIQDSVIKVDDKNVLVNIDVYEGPKYYVGNIKWSGNAKYTDTVLNRILGIRKGDIFSEEKLTTKLMGGGRNSDDISSLYMNDGYLTFSIDPEQTRIYNDTIDLNLRVYEGAQFTINNIIVKGNDVTNDRVVLRSIRTKPGQKFSKEAIMTSVREIAQLGNFDEQKTNPVPENINHAEGTVDIVYNVTEKPSDQVELSGGYGAGQIIGTLGLTFNNFSTSNFFDKSSWKPLPRGDGQKLSVRGQTSGKRYQSYSFSFSEPWLGGKKPIYFGLSAYTSSSSYGGFNYYTGEQMVKDSDLNRIWMTGVTATLGKRVQWPDNWFQVNTSLSFQRYKLQNYSNYFLFDNGTAYNINLTQEISRNTIDAPIYPTSGSNLKFSVQLTPPYSLFNKINYETSAPEVKYKWTEYHKWKFDSQWYAKIAGKLVFKAQAQFGFLGSYSNKTGISTFERFKLGGDGMQGFDFLQGSEIIAMRGYANGSIIPEGTQNVNIAMRSGSPIYTKYQMELRHPVMLNEQATVFVLAFAEAGNTWNKFSEYNPFKVRRAAGVGARIFLPIFGMLGIDYGHAFDPIPGLQSSQWKQNFTFSIMQNMGGF